MWLGMRDLNVFVNGMRAVQVQDG
ncbi:MAG: hypothetical protein LBQ62_00110 [Candidatus Accumulibacter sp.]|nr:hypothetical protein [Accumulibacter sp.]